jgi:hypothetical protein
MVSFKPRKAHHSFLKKGFREERDGDHVYYYFYYNGLKTQIKTHISHNSGDLSEWHINKMSHQIKLNRQQFIELVNCPLLEDDLIRIYLKSNELKN